jgi:Bacterial regulatory proteins, gntR family
MKRVCALAATLALGLAACGGDDESGGGQTAGGAEGGGTIRGPSPNLKSQAIYVALRERILSNDIAPGTRLVMRDVANEYAASDIPVREALRMLERDGSSRRSRTAGRR